MCIRDSGRAGQVPLCCGDRKWSEILAGGSGPVSYTHLDVYKRQFLFHTDRREGGHLYGDVLMTDLGTLRQDIKRNILYPCGVNVERKGGSAAMVLSLIHISKLNCAMTKLMIKWEQDNDITR